MRLVLLPARLWGFSGGMASLVTLCLYRLASPLALLMFRQGMR